MNSWYGTVVATRWSRFKPQYHEEGHSSDAVGIEGAVYEQ